MKMAFCNLLLKLLIAVVLFAALADAVGQSTLGSIKGIFRKRPTSRVQHHGYRPMYQQTSSSPYWSSSTPTAPVAPSHYTRPNHGYSTTGHHHHHHQPMKPMYNPSGPIHNQPTTNSMYPNPSYSHSSPPPASNYYAPRPQSTTHYAPPPPPPQTANHYSSAPPAHRPPLYNQRPVNSGGSSASAAAAASGRGGGASSAASAAASGHGNGASSSAASAAAAGHGSSAASSAAGSGGNSNNAASSAATAAGTRPPPHRPMPRYEHDNFEEHYEDPVEDNTFVSQAGSYANDNNGRESSSFVRTTESNNEQEDGHEDDDHHYHAKSHALSSDDNHNEAYNHADEDILHTDTEFRKKKTSTNFVSNTSKTRRETGSEVNAHDRHSAGYSKKRNNFKENVNKHWSKEGNGVIDEENSEYRNSDEDAEENFYDSGGLGTFVPLNGNKAPPRHPGFLQNRNGVGSGAAAASAAVSNDHLGRGVPSSSASASTASPAYH